MTWDDADGIMAPDEFPDPDAAYIWKNHDETEEPVGTVVYRYRVTAPVEDDT